MKKYGELNTVQKQRKGDKIDPDTTSFMTRTRQASLDRFSQDVLQHASTIKGIVLYSWIETKTSTGIMAFDSGITETMCVKVRIPELHAGVFPEPTSIPTANNPSAPADWETISRYPTFLAKDTAVLELGLPQPGTIVHVDFENRYTQTNPIYLGPIEISAITPAPGNPSPKDSHDESK